MKFLLSIFSISAVFATSILNANLVFETNNYYTHLKSKTKKAPLSFLYQNDSNNKLTNKFLKSTKLSYLANDPESSYFNDVLLKSIAYDKSSLKLTSSLANLNNYDLKHHESKIDTYLDKQDYSKMMAIKTKDQQNSIIDYNLVFLNHFFNNNALKFNPNGFIISRQKLLNAKANSLKTNSQSVITLNGGKKSQNQLESFLKNSNQNSSDALSLNISWSGINFNTNSNLITPFILHILNGSANLTNAATSEFQSVKTNTLNLKNNLNDPIWSAWDQEQTLRYMLEDETLGEDISEFPQMQKFFAVTEPSDEWESFSRQAINAVRAVKAAYKSPEEMYDFFKLYERTMTRFGKQYLGYNSQDNPLDPDAPGPSGEVPKDVAQDLNDYDQDAQATTKDFGVQVDMESEEMLAAESEGTLTTELQNALDNGLPAVEATADGIPVIGWIISLIILAITTTITIVIKTQLDKVNNWKINIGNLSPKGPWSLNKLRFDQKTRLFRQLNSSQIQFEGQEFKPWFGKITHKFVDFKPLHALNPIQTKTKKPSLDLMHQYNFLSGSNNNFNLIVNPTTWKQMVAAANMPSSQFSVKQILAKNNVNSNNLYLSNQNWVDLIKQIKDPALNQNYAADFKFQNSKLSYSNLTKNHQSNFKYQGDAYIKEMLVGNNSNQDLLLDSPQLKLLIQGLTYTKNHWNDSKAKTKTGKPLFPGLKNSIQYNPKNYQDFITWYYYCQLKPYIWVDSNSSDQVNIAFLKRIFEKLNSSKEKLSFKQDLNLVNNDEIIDLSSLQF